MASTSYEDHPRSIKHHVKRFILENRQLFQNKVVIDLPAGSGVTSRILREVGAQVHPYDLFPEYFKLDTLTCRRANVTEGVPVPDSFADAVICQEGMEHFSDQYRAFREFNRVLKMRSPLIVTTPNYSNLLARLSYFLFETEYLFKRMPPNEFHSVWMTNTSQTNEIYLGHIFLIGIQRLRLLATLSGFKIKRIIFTAASKTSLVILPFAYPFILLTSWWTLRNHIRRDRKRIKRRRPDPFKIPFTEREAIYRELMALNTNVRLLIDNHLFVEFEKESSLEAIATALHSQHKSFDVMT